jgi:hypothetical protein
MTAMTNKTHEQKKSLISVRFPRKKKKKTAPMFVKCRNGRRIFPLKKKQLIRKCHELALYGFPAALNIVVFSPLLQPKRKQTQKSEKRRSKSLME